MRSLLLNLRHRLRRAVQRTGYDISRVDPAARLDARGRLKHRFPDFDDEHLDTTLAVAPYTMTDPERVHALVEAVRYVVRHRIEGCFVECGVWKGGSMLAAVRTLQALGVTDREIHLFDTFEGMSEPGEEDAAWYGESASEALSKADKADARSVWCRAGIEEVRANLATSGYPEGRLHFVPGKVEDTLPDAAPDRIALLRLDTDWYESTRHELEVLYPRLVPGGVLIIDDYGHWTGAKKATDEYLARLDTPVFLQRIDYTGRLLIKPFGAPASA